MLDVFVSVSLVYLSVFCCFFYCVLCCVYVVLLLCVVYSFLYNKTILNKKKNMTTLHNTPGYSLLRIGSVLCI